MQCLKWLWRIVAIIGTALGIWFCRNWRYWMKVWRDPYRAVLIILVGLILVTLVKVAIDVHRMAHANPFF